MKSITAGFLLRLLGPALLLLASMISMIFGAMAQTSDGAEDTTLFFKVILGANPSPGTLTFTTVTRSGIADLPNGADGSGSNYEDIVISTLAVTNFGDFR